MTECYVQIQLKPNGNNWKVVRHQFTDTPYAIRYAKWFKRDWAFGVRVINLSGTEVLFQTKED